MLVLPLIILAALAFPAGAVGAQSRDTTAGAVAQVVALEQVDGGLDWYGEFSHPLPSDASHFPIGVWFESVVSQERH